MTSDYETAIHLLPKGIQFLLYLHMSSSRIKLLVTVKGIETKNMFINNFHQIYTSPKKKSFYNFSGFKFKGN